MTDIPDARVPVRYVSDEPGEIALPGYLNAVPSIVVPGDVFVIDREHADDVLSAARFEAAPDADPVLESLTGLTIDQLLERLPDDVLEDAPTTPKAAVVEYVAEFERTHPQPSGESATVPVDDQLTDETTGASTDE